MKNRNGIVFAAAFCAGITAADSAIGAGIYKWVDKDGKVHYSQTRPGQDDASELRAPPPSANTDPELPQGESIRGADGQCLTMKCLADEMESNRRQREAGYARQHAENERQAKKRTGSSAPSQPEHPLYSDAHMRTQCLHGQCGSDTRNCDDVKRLRECAAMQASERDLYRSKRDMGWRDTHGNRLP